MRFMVGFTIGFTRLVRRSIARGLVGLLRFIGYFVVNRVRGVP